ncbi:MAG: DEAD/DEAH box helicase [Alphaproteobacteria bacterium]|nr:DEAD/DEAH box helicase [Alphaproteobacteria bacterium SS10]
MTFGNLNLAKPILRAIEAEGYDKPTPIQAQAITPLMDGADLVGIAQTGTGKTAAFLLPLLNKLNSDQDKIGQRRAKALILVPTRELATQIADGLKIYGKDVPHKATVVVGGVKPGGQIKALTAGLDIIIATPGRLLDHISTGAVRLDKTTTVVLDEADQMLDLGFMPTIRKIMAKLPNSRQTAMFSATMPDQIRKLANDFLHRPVEVSVAPASKPIEKIEQSVIHVRQQAKRAVLVKLLADRSVERAIVFTRTKHGADRVVKQLDKAGLISAAIHGNKSQNNRQRTLNAFKKGDIRILVATDVAARGIDIDDVSHVINYELPSVSESYVHRIGRTARAGRDGVAIALCDGAERKYLRDIEKLTKIKLQVMEMDIEDALDAERAAQAMAAELGGKQERFEELEDERQGDRQRPHKRRGQGKDGGNRGRGGHGRGGQGRGRQDRDGDNRGSDNRQGEGRGNRQQRGRKTHNHDGRQDRRQDGYRDDRKDGRKDGYSDSRGEKRTDRRNEKRSDNRGENRSENRGDNRTAGRKSRRHDDKQGFNKGSKPAHGQKRRRGKPAGGKHKHQGKASNDSGADAGLMKMLG